MTLIISVSILVVSFLLLLLSYAKTGASRKDFGHVPMSMHPYFMITAFTCFVLLWVAAVTSFVDDSIEDMRIKIAVCISIYFLLQIGFIPLTRYALKKEKARIALQALLILCTIPIGVLFVFVFENRFLAIITGICLLHVVLNDAILFGSLF